MVAQHLKLLTNFLANVAIAGIEPTQSALKRIHVAEFKLPSSDCIYAIHDLYEPPRRASSRRTELTPLG